MNPPRVDQSSLAWRAARAALVLVVAVVVPGCDRGQNEPKKSASTNNSTTSPRPAVNTNISVRDIDVAAAAQAPGEVAPVYPVGGKVNPMATRLCEAMWELPRKRRGECCGGKPTSASSFERCVDVLSAALQDGAVTLQSTDVALCVEARQEQLRGCEWVGNLVPPPPTPCVGLLTGMREQGDECRATLECREGLRCAGAGPTDAGKCAPPGPPGAICNTGADALAAAARQPARRSVCEGFCAVNKCRAARAPGEKCSTSLECGGAAHCDGQVCRSGTAAEGERCAGGGCEVGLLCLSGACTRPLRAGACTNDLECIGACVDGQCGKRCERVIAR